MSQHQEVFVIIRHTRAGDKRVSIVDDRETAMQRAEELARLLALDYGHGRTSVFKATLTLHGKALKP
jgi:hypothetical protein